MLVRKHTPHRSTIPPAHTHLCAPVQLREKKDEAATRERFWDVTQSKIGQLTGTTARELDAAAAHAEEANRTEAKFAGGRLDEGALVVFTSVFFCASHDPKGEAREQRL